MKTSTSLPVLLYKLLRKPYVIVAVAWDLWVLLAWVQIPTLGGEKAAWNSAPNLWQLLIMCCCTEKPLEQDWTKNISFVGADASQVSASP